MEPTGVLGRTKPMTKDEQIFKLYKLLDDIDTLDDAVKSNDKAFREHTRTIQRKRHDIVSNSEADILYDQFYGKENTSHAWYPEPEKDRP